MCTIPVLSLPPYNPSHLYAFIPVLEVVWKPVLLRVKFHVFVNEVRPWDSRTLGTTFLIWPLEACVMIESNNLSSVWVEWGFISTLGQRLVRFVKEWWVMLTVWPSLRLRKVRFRREKCSGKRLIRSGYGYRVWYFEARVTGGGNGTGMIGWSLGWRAPVKVRLSGWVEIWECHWGCSTIWDVRCHPRWRCWHFHPGNPEIPELIEFMSTAPFIWSFIIHPFPLTGFRVLA